MTGRRRGYHDVTREPVSSPGVRRGATTLALAATGVGATLFVAATLTAAITAPSEAPPEAPEPAGRTTAPRSAHAWRNGVGAAQAPPIHEYDGSWTFVRIRTRGGRRGFGRFGRFGGGWAHDYPDAERNFARIVSEFTEVDARLVADGGNILAFDDPRLLAFPIAYVSEPDEWYTDDAEASALRAYLLKGGFVIFDDFFEQEMENLHRQMRRVFPELDFLPLDGTEEVWDSFFGIDPLGVYLEGPRKTGTPRFWGLFEGNDKRRRMMAVAGAGADIGDLWEWSNRGYFPVDPTNEAYEIGINYLIYALTH